MIGMHLIWLYYHKEIISMQSALMKYFIIQGTKQLGVLKSQASPGATRVQPLWTRFGLKLWSEQNLWKNRAANWNTKLV